MEVDSLTNSASIIAGFASAALVFRLQREIQMEDQAEITWVPRADWLLIVSALASLLLVILPFSLPLLPSMSALLLAQSALSLSVVLLFGYLFAILAHYRLILGRSRSGPRENPEPAERVIFWITVSIGFIVFVISMYCGVSAS
jgi:hypothetical protein